MKPNKKLKLRGSLKRHTQSPLYMIFLLVLMVINIYMLDVRAGGVALVYLFIYSAIATAIYILISNNLLGDLVRFGTGYSQVQKKLLKEMAVPYAVLDIDGKILWANEEMKAVLGQDKINQVNIEEFFPEITMDKLPSEEGEFIHLEYGIKNYLVQLKLIVSPEFMEDSAWIIEQKDAKDDGFLVAMYLRDETENVALLKENADQKLITGLLYIDNYDEALDSIDEVKRSLLTALVDRKINKYMQSIDAIVKKLEKDKYIFVFQHKYLSVLETNKFSILEEVRNVSIGNEMSVTVSIGLSVNSDSYIESYDRARAAIDLALGRGGDQAVVKEGDKIAYYGGKSIQVEKNTRVKARVKAHALKEFIGSKDKVVIMGHSLADIDSLGAAVGVYRIAKTLNKRAHIVIKEATISIRPMMTRFQNNSDYEDDMFLSVAKAQEIVDNDTLLVIVDVNRPSYTECPSLLTLTKNIVILDHHRQTGEAIENAVLSYIEPYASSACEMVAEILQYIGDGLKIKQVEADALYAGIMTDTNNFLTKTGVRTFEAAAFLRRNGADVTRIRKAFRTDLPEYQAKAEAIASAEIYMNYYAFSKSAFENIDSATIVAAQVANELLNIADIRASFVVTEYKGQVYVSARSIDELNVQVVMEKLGGGGHMSAAGTQFDSSTNTVDEVVDKVKAVLKEMTESGEI